MSGADASSALFKQALAGTAQALLKHAGPALSLSAYNLLQKGLPYTLEILLSPIAQRGAQGEATAKQLLALLNKQAANNPGFSPPQDYSESIDGLTKLSPNLVSILSAFFPENDVASNKEVSSVFKEMSAELLSLQGLVQGQVSANLSGVPRKIPSDIANKLVKDFEKRIGKIRGILGRLKSLMDKVKAPRLNMAFDLMEAELISQELRVRVVCAIGFALPGLIYNVVQTVFGDKGEELPSTKSIGNEVHTVLQQKYRNWLPKVPEPTPVEEKYIVQDNRVYWTQTNSEELSKLAWARKDGTLLALVFARYNEEVFRKYLGKGVIYKEIWSMYREDTLDLIHSSVYEIKPVRSAFAGVLQEFQYRHSFNIANGALQDLKEFNDFRNISSKITNNIKKFTAPFFVFPGEGLMWSNHLGPFNVQDEGKKSPVRVVFPFTVKQLKGLVLYITVTSPNLKILLALVPDLAKKFNDEIQRLAKKYAEQLEQVYVFIENVIMAAIIAVLFVILIEMLLPLLSGEAILIGGAAALRQLLSLVPLGAFSELGLLPDNVPVGVSVDPVQAIINGIQQAAAQLQMSVKDPPHWVGDFLYVQFEPAEGINDSAASSVAYDTGIDMTIATVVFRGLPINSLPLLEYLLKLAHTIAGFALLHGIDKAQNDDKPVV